MNFFYCRLFFFNFRGTTPILAWCMSKLISDMMLRNACNVQGMYIHDLKNSVLNDLSHENI